MEVNRLSTCTGGTPLGYLHRCIIRRVVQFFALLHAGVCVFEKKERKKKGKYFWVH